MELIFFGDIFWSTLKSFLTVNDILILKDVNTEFHQHYKNVLRMTFISRINKRLDEILGENKEYFKKDLEKSKSVISGSLILQSIVDEKWNSDIDIYTSFPLDTSIDKNNNWRRSSSDRTIFEYIFTRCPMHKHFMRGILKYVKQFKYEEYDVNVITLKLSADYSKIYEFISSMFDLDICSNMYYIENGVEKLRIKCLSNCVNKRMILNQNFGTVTTMYRLEKYKKRGFKLIDDMSKFIESFVKCDIGGSNRDTKEILRKRIGNSLDNLCMYLSLRLNLKDDKIPYYYLENDEDNKKIIIINPIHKRNHHRPN